MDLNKTKFLTSAGTEADLDRLTGKEVVFSGRSNAGKSTLINKLCNKKKLAKTSNVPGKTITINFFELGDNCFLVDLPGYGYAKRSGTEIKKFSALIDAYFKSKRDIRLLVQILDARHAPSKDDLIMIDFLRRTGIEFIIVFNKTDKLNKSELARRKESRQSEMENFKDIKTIDISAVTGEGLDELKELIGVKLCSQNA